MRTSQQRAFREKIQDQANAEFAAAVLEGLAKPAKSIPCRYLYDARGSELFEQITALEEYYPTRTETAILRTNADSIISESDRGCALVEFGSGSSIKTEILLDRLAGGMAYVPIDVSRSALAQAKARLISRYPSLEIYPVLADFSQPVSLPAQIEERLRLGFFPGSTIGNLAPDDAIDLLAVFRRALGSDGRLIIGVDLKKDPRTLIRAYNDEAGVTAEFNLNLLHRINHELGASIDVEAFRHEAIYNPRVGRVEMHLVSRHAQRFEICGRQFDLRDRETIHTENSYKYDPEQFRDVARKAGWTPERLWADPARLFSVHELTCGAAD